MYRHTHTRVYCEYSSSESKLNSKVVGSWCLPYGSIVPPCPLPSCRPALSPLAWAARLLPFFVRGTLRQVLPNGGLRVERVYRRDAGDSSTDNISPHTARYGDEGSAHTKRPLPCVGTAASHRLCRRGGHGKEAKNVCQMIAALMPTYVAHVHTRRCLPPHLFKWVHTTFLSQR